MKYRYTYFAVLVFLLLFAVAGHADTIPQGCNSKSTPPRCVSLRYADTITQDRILNVDSKRCGKSFFRKIVDYFSVDGDKASVKLSKNRIQFLGGPFYNTDSKLGFAVMGAGSYRMRGCDTIEPLSITQLSFNVTTAKFWAADLKGVLFTPGAAMRVNYLLDFSYEPSYFWGIGYDKGNDDGNKTMQHKHFLKFKAEGLFCVVPHLYLGPTLLIDYCKSDTIERPWLLEGQDRVVNNWGVGVVLEYDTRDLITDARSGCFVHVGQLFRPKFLWNDYAFSTTEFQASWYHRLWKSGVLAAEVMGQFNFGNPSWAMMAQVGDSYRMRGYYRGRYRDKHLLNFQVELRQSIWRRHGFTLWLGGGNAFHDKASLKHFLPNYGLGYRFAFRRRMNVRFDVGFSKKGHPGIIFGINEAF